MVSQSAPTGRTSVLLGYVPQAYLTLAERSLRYACSLRGGRGMTGVTRPRWEERDLAHWRRGLGDDFKTTGGGDGCWTYTVMEFSSMKHQREHRMGNYMSFDPLIWRGEQGGANRSDLEQGVQRATELGFLVRHHRKVAASPLLQVLLAVEYITRVLRPTGPRTLGPAPIVTVHKLLHLLKVGGDGARPHPGLLEGIERGLLHVSQSNHATWVEVRWGADSGPAPGQAPAPPLRGRVHAEPPRPPRRPASAPEDAPVEEWDGMRHPTIAQLERVGGPAPLRPRFRSTPYRRVQEPYLYLRIQELVAKADRTCGVCLNDMTPKRKPVWVPGGCPHAMCEGCLREYLASRRDSSPPLPDTCPFCFAFMHEEERDWQAEFNDWEATSMALILQGASASARANWDSRGLPADPGAGGQDREAVPQERPREADPQERPREADPQERPREAAPPPEDPWTARRMFRGPPAGPRQHQDWYRAVWDAQAAEGRCAMDAMSEMVGPSEDSQTRARCAEVYGAWDDEDLEEVAGLADPIAVPGGRVGYLPQTMVYYRLLAAGCALVQYQPQLRPLTDREPSLRDDVVPRLLRRGSVAINKFGVWKLTSQFALEDLERWEAQPEGGVLRGFQSLAQEFVPPGRAAELLEHWGWEPTPIAPRPTQRVGYSYGETSPWTPATPG